MPKTKKIIAIPTILIGFLLLIGRQVPLPFHNQASTIHLNEDALMPFVLASKQNIHIPVKLHLVKNSGLISSNRSQENIEDLFEQTQKIWNQAQIVFDTQIVETVISKETTSEISQLNLQSIYSEESCCDGAIHIFFVNSLAGINGVAVSPSAAFVADLTSVNDYRATAHEIGHLLRLPHTSDSTGRLLFQGVNGENLTDNEVEITRSAAQGRISTN